MVQLMPLHPKIPTPLASFKSRLYLRFWYRLTQVVLEKRPLVTGCDVVVTAASLIIGTELNATILLYDHCYDHIVMITVPVLLQQIH